METAPHHSAGALDIPRRIIVRGVNWLGDAVMTTPALQRLRERFPEAHIALLGAEKLSELWRHSPAINETISFGPTEGLLTTSKKVRAGQFDLALILPNSPRSALELWLGRVPRRVGYSRPWRNVFLTHAVVLHADAVKMRKRSPEEIRRLTAASGASGIRPETVARSSSHQVFDYLHLVKALGADPAPLAPHLAVADEELNALRMRLGIIENNKPIFGLNPGAEYGPAKRWPVERFIAAARALRKETGCTWLIFGGKGDIAIASEISSAISDPQSATHNLAGNTTLRELCAGLKLCRVVLTNDTGPMHVAAAVGTPVVVPFGSTSPELTGPGLPGAARHALLRSDAPCSPCFLRECPIDFRCMRGIDVEAVVSAVLRLMRNPR